MGAGWVGGWGALGRAGSVVPVGVYVAHELLQRVWPLEACREQAALPAAAQLAWKFPLQPLPRTRLRYIPSSLFAAVNMSFLATSPPAAEREAGMI